jgi:hypothetical protein
MARPIAALCAAMRAGTLPDFSDLLVLRLRRKAVGVTIDTAPARFISKLIVELREKGIFPRSP